MKSQFVGHEGLAIEIRMQIYSRGQVKPNHEKTHMCRFYMILFYFSLCFTMFIMSHVAPAPPGASCFCLSEHHAKVVWHVRRPWRLPGNPRRPPAP